jgi:NADPH-dependent ferric siderophore reductase
MPSSVERDLRYHKKSELREREGMGRRMSEQESEPLRRLVSHELRFRRLELRAVARLTPRLSQITLGGSELKGFCSLAPDDHVKVLFPRAGESEPVLPALVQGQVIWPSDRGRALARDYTPLRFDAERPELDLQIVLHAGGHATAWLERAEPGAILGLGGPRGSYAFTRMPSPLLLAGDETALPAIARFLRELPGEAQVEAFIEVNDERDQIQLPSAARSNVRWLYRRGAQPGSTTLLVDALRASTLPALTYAFLAGEASAVQDLKRHLCDERRVSKAAIGARGYWKRGAQDHQEPHDD